MIVVIADKCNKTRSRKITICIKLFAINHRLLGEFLAALWSCNISNHDEDNNYSKERSETKEKRINSK
jgi:hypothetical protein